LGGKGLKTRLECYALINGLRKIQAREYTYTEFVSVLKKRLCRYTGMQEIMFYDDVQICDKLKELGFDD
jgi:hypothetical protein